ncbi:hypothetical protein AOLI_G00060840 [Acnodon oligacanthus]
MQTSGKPAFERVLLGDWILFACVRARSMCVLSYLDDDEDDDPFGDIPFRIRALFPGLGKDGVNDITSERAFKTALCSLLRMSPSSLGPLLGTSCHCNSRARAAVPPASTLIQIDPCGTLSHRSSLS